MEAIIARPAVSAKSPSAKKTTAKRQPSSTPTEGDKLALKAAGPLQAMVLNIIYDFDDQPRTLKNAHLEAVVHLLGRLLDPTSYERTVDDPEDGDILGHLEEVASELSDACQRMEEPGAISGETVAMHLILTGTLNQAEALAHRIVQAYKLLPASLEDLRALTTFAGAKPFRDRPAPPIRRVERTDDELKNTPVHEAGRTGKMLALQCTWDISVVAEEVAKMGDWMEADCPATLGGLLRCYGLRIQALSEQVTAYLDGDGTTAGEMHKVIFKGARPFRGEEE